MENYEQIVIDWYDALHEPFVRLIRSQFNGLSIDEIEDIYQDTFVAVHENLHRGAIAPDTNWRAYIMTIGINQATTRTRSMARFVAPVRQSDDDENPDWLSRFASLEELTEEMQPEVNNRERMIAVMNGIMSSLTGKCQELLPAFYYGGLSMEQICEELGYANTDSAKTQRYKCFQRLQNAVKARLKMMDMLP